MRKIARDHLKTLSGSGLILGTLLFAAALTPTLVPRSYVTQGVLAGACFAAGYAIGVACRLLWRYLELPEPHNRLRRSANILVGIACMAVALFFLWQAAEWQNSVRTAMGMTPVDSVHPFKLCMIALLTFAGLLALARLFGLMVRFLAARSGRYVPRRLANVIAVTVALLLTWTIANDFLARSVFHVLESSYREFDALLEPERPRPTDPLKTGSDASLVGWAELGRAGREFITSGPSATEIGAFTGRPAIEPIRVYVGLRDADSPESRAKLALEEMKRQGGFDRSILIVITPTGTGWIDPAAMDTVEYLHDGDTASVAVQYSYLSSPLSLLAQPEQGAETARALFSVIYGYWKQLPKDRRPRLYLHGLSLGAMNSERSTHLFETIGDPIDGALWSGPPFESRIWRAVTDNRNEGSPAWLPEFQDGRLVRFMNQNGPSVAPAAPWGPMRIVYLQYASDPVVFFDYHDLYRRPEWMQAPLGPDVSRQLHWYPVVTMLQLALDMALATTTPMGHGHVYAPEHYVDAWAAVTGTPTWSPEQLSALKLYLSRKASAAVDAEDAEQTSYDDRGG